MIDKALGLGCPDPAETYSSSPHLYAELDIPADAGGTVGTPRKSQAKRATSGQRDSDRSEPRSSKGSRQRQRTRGGKSATGHPVAASATNGDAEAPTSATPSAGTATANSGDGAHNGRRRRRRPRKSAGVTANAN
jgi:hypothetical protein